MALVSVTASPLPVRCAIAPPRAKPPPPGAVLAAAPLPPTRTNKPPLHGRHWMAITGKPLGATAGAMVFQKGGNAVDAALHYLARMIEAGDLAIFRTAGAYGATMASSSRKAFWIVLTLTPYVVAKSRILGTRIPTAHSPLTILGR